MSLGPRLDLRMGQSLVMTPQLQQAIKLLQLSNMELSEYVEQELEQNPLLERDDQGMNEDVFSEEARDGERLDALEGIEEGSGLADVDAVLSDAPLHGESDQAIDADYDNQWNNDSATETVSREDGATLKDESAAMQDDWGGAGSSSGMSMGSGGGGGDEMPSLDQTLAGEVSLREYLMGQLPLLFSDAGEKMIAVCLIDMLDDAGYLAGDLQEVADMFECDLSLVEQVLARLQTLEPAGLFARGLSECLALQLKERDRLDPAMQCLLDNLELMAKRDVAQLVKLCGVDVQDITDMVAEIRELDPRPAAKYEHAQAQPVIPDVFMRAMPDGTWGIELNSETLPKVLVNNNYYTQVSRGARTDKEKQYISECYQTASWLVKSLHQRATTILKVAGEIVRQQDAFFAKGVQALRPLVLRDIADAIEMHESTVSRVTSNKYIATPRGIFELKYFFSSSVGGSDGGDAVAGEAVRQRIKALVDGEDPKKVLSDDKLVAVLKAEGIDVARRTVAKYRDALGIASSVQRRREKSANF